MPSPVVIDFGSPPVLPPAFRYIPNHGNAGDAVIGLAFEQLVRAQASTLLDDDSPPTWVVGGGGNLVPMYSHIATRLRNLPRDAAILILSSTVSQRWEVLSCFAHVHLHCRERETFRTAELHGIPATLGHDLAFFLDYRPYLDGKDRAVLDTLHAFRTDGESARDTSVPHDNRDLSLEWPQQVWHVGRCEQAANPFISTIALYRRVITDRLHVAIVATMLGKDVEFHGNSYFKNRAVYEHSLVHLTNCRFVE